jgi:hypothetical protein
MTNHKWWAGLSKYVVAVIVVHAVELVMVAGLWYGLDLQARTTLSHKLGIGSQELDFNEYVLANFKSGMTRRQILEQGDAIGPYLVKPFFIGNEYCETWVFDLRAFDTRYGSLLSICYDENGLVTSVKEVGYQ